MIKTVKQSEYAGVISIPPSKSDSQRAILCSALAKGKSELLNVGKSADELAMLETVKQFEDGSSMKSIFVGESGLGVRLLTSVVSVLDQEVEIVGHGSLNQRDLSFFDRYFPKMGVKVESNNGKLPLKIQGPIQGGTYEVDGSESSQYISGLLMALPMAKTDSKLVVKDLKSVAYVDMTLKTLESFGIEIEANGSVYSIKGNQKYNSCRYQIDGDWSSASCWIVASALGKNISIDGLSLSSLQADKQLLTALIHAGCQVLRSDDGISIDGTNRLPLNFDASDCPDLFPALAIYAALTEGENRIKGIHRLGNKESDRALALKTELGKLGIDVLLDLETDCMIISGQNEVVGGQVDAWNDHRIAMCMGVLGMFSSSEMEITGAESVAKSYPDFWLDLEKLGQ